MSACVRFTTSYGTVEVSVGDDTLLVYEGAPRAVEIIRRHLSSTAGVRGRVLGSAATPSELLGAARDAALAMYAPRVID